MYSLYIMWFTCGDKVPETNELLKFFYDLLNRSVCHIRCVLMLKSICLVGSNIQFTAVNCIRFGNLSFLVTSLFLSFTVYLWIY